MPMSECGKETLSPSPDLHSWLGSRQPGLSRAAPLESEARQAFHPQLGGSWRQLCHQLSPGNKSPEANLSHRCCTYPCPKHPPAPPVATPMPASHPPPQATRWGYSPAPALLSDSPEHTQPFSTLALGSAAQRLLIISRARRPNHKYLLYTKYLFIYLLWPRQVLVAAHGIFTAARGLSCGMRVGSSSLTRDRTWAPCIGSTEPYPLDHQGSPQTIDI